MKKLALLAVLAAATVPAFAGEAYFAGSVGRSTLDIKKSELDRDLADAGIVVSSSSLEKDGTGYKVQFGYQVNRHFAVEGGYIDLGKAEYEASAGGVNAKATVQAAGWNAAVLGIVPIGDAFSVFGKVGAIAAEAKGKVEASGLGGSVSVSDSKTNWETMYGAGLSYRFNEVVSARVEYEKFLDVGDKDVTGEADVTLISAGVVLWFE